MDDANRTVVYHRYTVNVKGVIADPSGTETEMTAGVRALLTKQGQTLVVWNKGCDLYVNSSSPYGFINDVCFGPKPRIISWTPIGASRAAEIEWECEACIAYCLAPKYYSGVMAFNYTVTYSLDYRGLTTRNIAGYFEIAMTRNRVHHPGLLRQLPDCG